jgi:NTP pyrophosphatase (non-canonical NTP hydrolase)
MSQDYNHSWPNPCKDEELKALLDRALGKYIEKYPERGTSWLTCPIEFLLDRLVQEAGELRNRPSLDEAADCLNFVLFIAVRIAREGEDAVREQVRQRILRQMIEKYNGRRAER